MSKPRAIDTDVPICADCKHYYLTLGMRIQGYSPRCLRTASKPRIDIVTGKIRKLDRHMMITCSDEREDDRVYGTEDHCGPQARFWIPKRKKDLFFAIVHSSKA